MGAEFKPDGPPPAFPPPALRSRRGGPARAQIKVKLTTTTPILGGGAVAGALKPEDVDIIRAPSIRGQLRFWWRALRTEPLLLERPSELFESEAKLWGCAAKPREQVGRSEVEVLVTAVRACGLDQDSPSPETEEGYALFPARRTRDLPPVPRRRSGLTFTVEIGAPTDSMADVKAAVRAWILFGGYGARTRRGIGALTAARMHANGSGWRLPDQSEWLVADAADSERAPVSLHTELNRSLWPSGAAAGTSPLTSFPLLAGSILLVGPVMADPVRAWRAAIGWLRAFRQVPYGRNPGTAVIPGTGKVKPGRSYWPEADKLRHLLKVPPSPKHPPLSAKHRPLYEDGITATWPRAEFGLPIIGRFIDYQAVGDPPPFELTWEVNGKRQDRLASPLIVKALPTQAGFRPCALWLARGYPPGELIALYEKSGTKAKVPGSNAAFGSMGSPQDKLDYTARKAPIAGAASVKQAFMDWVAKQPGVTKVLL